MGPEMALAFKSVVESIHRRGSVRSAIVTGAGPAFAAGGDLNMLKEKAALGPETNRRAMLEFYHSFLCISKLPFPVIAAVNGHAIGAGLCLALACDFRFVSNQAKIGFPFTRLGLHPGMGACYFLPRIIGHAHAADLLVTGRTISSEIAVQFGLFAEIHDSATLMPSAMRFAKSLEITAPNAVAGLLETLRPNESDLLAALEREAAQQSMNYADAEFLEGINAALERRVPKF